MMLTAIDIRTVFLLTTFVAGMSAVAMVLLWRAHPGERSLQSWAFGSCLVAVGFLGIALRGVVPIFLSVPIANACIVVGHALYLSGVNRLGKRRDVPVLVLAVIAVLDAGLLAYFTYVDSSTVARVAMQFSLIGGLSLVTARRLLAVIGAELGIARRAVAAIFAIHGGVLLLRVVLMGWDVPADNLFAPSGVHAATFGVMLLFYAALMYGFPALMYAKDMAARAAVVRRLGEGDENYRALLSSSLDGFWLVDAEGRLLDVNQRYVEQSGFTRDELLRMHVTDLEGLENPTATADHIQKIVATGHDQFESVHRRKDGSQWHVEISVIYLDSGGGRLFAFLRDISERKRAEVALRESEDRFRRLVTNSPLPMLITTLPPRSVVTLMSRRFTELFGYAEEQVRDVSMWWPLAYPDPEYRREIQEKWGAAIAEMEAAGRDYIEPVRARVHCGDGTIRVVEAGMSLAGDRALVVFNDITELEAHRHDLEELVAARTEQLARARDAAVAASRAKSAFLSNMSHELRTPLNAILGFSQLLERDGNLNAEQRADLATINDSGRHLLAVINDVLEISRIESGRMTLTRQDFDLTQMLRTVADSVQLRAQAKGLHLRVEWGAGLPQHVNTDLGKLRQILLNLLSNAIKYTERGAVILLADATGSDGNATLRFEVRDSGGGIGAENLARIFEPFYQTEYGISVGEGFGLGLAISRQYADLLGGSLVAESVVGHGSIFRLVVPARVVAPRVAQPLAAADRAGMPGRRVLVAEDNAANRSLMVQLLERAGYVVATATDGAQAIELFQSWRPDLVWMDMRMPVMDGYEATRRIRALEGGATVPILALTAYAFDEDRKEILAAGCNDVLTKPLEADRVLALMDRYLAAGAEPA